MEREGMRYEKERGDVKKQEEMGEKGVLGRHCRISFQLFPTLPISFCRLSISINYFHILPPPPRPMSWGGEMGEGGKRWEEMERDGKRWKEMERDGKSWEEMERDGES